MARVTLHGMEKLQAALKRAPELVKAESQQAVRVSTFAIAQRARALAPQDTGRLRAAISSSARGQSGRVLIDKSAHYWRFVEYGTVTMPSRPFIRTAAELESGDFVQRVRMIGSKLEKDWPSGGGLL